MKTRHVICLIMLLFVAACDSSRSDISLKSDWVVSPKLSAIDSLMWQQPDSALAMLQDYFACRDALNASPNDASPLNDASLIQTDSIKRRNHCVSTVYNDHYAQLLASELLYKNDYAQTNRMELLQAVAYFDSLVRQAPPLKGGWGDSRRTLVPNDDLFFLAARAHYINGVGYYERDSVVEACKEYIKALETMESHFAEKELVGEKAKFMTYTYNRLGDMFSEQFMMESAIYCYEQSLIYCLIEPTSPFGVSNTLYRIGKQHDKIGKKNIAKQYYEQSLERLPNINNLLYRDIVSTKALNDYQLGAESEQSLNALKQILALAVDESEQLTRFLSIGDIFFEEKMYDSALVYLEPVFQNKNIDIFQIQAADYLHIIYDSLGKKEKRDEYMRFLAYHKKSTGQNKALVSKLNDLFQGYQSDKQTRKVVEERWDAIWRTVEIVIPIAVFATFVMVFTTKRKGKKRMELERQSHRVEQAALSGRLKQSNQALRELKGQIRQQESNAAQKAETQAVTFTDEPICRLIMERVNKGQFKSKVDFVYYKDYALDKEHLMDLRMAVDCHFGQFTTRLKKAYPALTKGDLDYCCLYLLGLTDADVAALMQRAYNTVSERRGKLRKIFGGENALFTTLWNLVNKNSID